MQPHSQQHYRMTTLEAIDVIEAWELGYHLGNVIKYIARHPYKGDALGDMYKALYYLQRHIQLMEQEDG
jgi:hypothetical protein